MGDLLLMSRSPAVGDSGSSHEQALSSPDSSDCFDVSIPAPAAGVADVAATVTATGVPSNTRRYRAAVDVVAPLPIEAGILGAKTHLVRDAVAAGRYFDFARLHHQL